MSWLLSLLVQRTPHALRPFYSTPVHQCPCEYQSHVLTSAQGSQSIAGQFPFNGQRSRELLDDKLNGPLLHSAAIMKVVYTHGLVLTDAPRTARSLTQSEDRIPGLIKDNGGKVQQIQSRLYQDRVPYDNLNILLYLFPEPLFPQLRF